MTSTDGGEEVRQCLAVKAVTRVLNARRSLVEDPQALSSFRATCTKP